MQKRYKAEHFALYLQSFSNTYAPVDELKKIGFSSLSDLIESNPNILNLDKHDIDYYVNSKVSEGLSLEDIVDELESDSFLFNEM